MTDTSAFIRETLVLPMMMFGQFSVYEKEKDESTGKFKTVYKTAEKSGKRKAVKKKVIYSEAAGDLGIYPSVNHIYSGDGRGGKKLTKPAEDLLARWNAMARHWAYNNEWEMTSKEKVVVEMVAHFPDQIGRDTNNVFKLLLDSLEGVIYDNDFYALPRVADFTVPEKKSKVKVQPRFELRIFKRSDEVGGAGEGIK